MSGVTRHHYTPLESLLFFQALKEYSPTSINFIKISGDLLRIPLVRSDAAFGKDRLSPDALQALYLSLLKEEARRDLEKALHKADEVHDGTLSPGSRKRKAPSPSLPTVEEAAKHSHLLPSLLHRLYVGYREAAVAGIREDERKYDALTREIEEIERGEWDGRLQHHNLTQENGFVASAQNREQTTSNGVHEDHTHEGRPSARDPHQPGSSAEERPPLRAKIDAMINHEPEGTDGNISPPRQRTSSIITTLPPLSEMAPDHSPGPSRPNSQHALTSQFPPPLQPGSAYQIPSPVPHQSPYTSQYARQAMTQGLSPSPKLPNPMAGHSPSSPRPMLPLPPGMKLPPGSPVMQNGLPPHRIAPQMTPHQYPSPNQRFPQPPQSPHMPAPPGYQQYTQYQGRQQPFSPQQPQQQQQHPVPYPTRAPHQGGVQLPPFQVAAQEPNKAHQQQLAQQAASQQARPLPAPPTYRQPGQAQLTNHTPYVQPLQPRPQPISELDQQAKTVLAGLNRYQSPQPRTWNPKRRSYPARAHSPTPPDIEAFSPERKPAQPVPLPVDEELTPSTRRSKRQASAGLAPSMLESTHTLDPPPRPKHGEKKQPKRTRGNSVASSVVASSTRGRTRSQSVMSLAGAPTEERVLRSIKNEPSTPGDVLADDDATNVSTPANGRPPRRTRRGTAHSQALSTGKRKRQPSPTATDEDGEAESFEIDSAQVPPREYVVLASRNFARLSAVIMNDITTHRHAGPFQKPVREKDAEGYQDIIKRPQDLKSIKAAITAGSRAIATATIKDSTTDSPAATPSANAVKEGGILMLEKTADLIPPKAIVNSSQLEKEVMRMFANAVMFNPGEEGIVQDAREMAEDIEAKVRDWRGAERQVEGSRDDDEDMAGSAKRRKA